MMDFS